MQRISHNPRQGPMTRQQVEELLTVAQWREHDSANREARPVKQTAYRAWLWLQAETKNLRYVRYPFTAVQLSEIRQLFCDMQDVIPLNDTLALLA